MEGKLEKFTVYHWYDIKEVVHPLNFKDQRSWYKKGIKMPEDSDCSARMTFSSLGKIPNIIVTELVIKGKPHYGISDSLLLDKQ